MKTLLLLFALVLFVPTMQAQERPFAGKTKNKTVKKMKKRQIKKAKKGKSYYYRTKNGKIKKRGFFK